MISQPKICTHFHNIKQEKFSNYLQKKDSLNKCDQFQCIQDEERWLCIECAYVGCSRNSKNQCALQHYYSSKHKLILSLRSQMIWCYDCDDDLESIIEEVQDKRCIKVQEFVQMIRQSFFNYQKTQKSNNQFKNNINNNNNNNNNNDNNNNNNNKYLVQQITKNNVSYLEYVPQKVFGLKNLGNTCFFNSIMQCLNASVKLTASYLDGNLDFQAKYVNEDNQNDGINSNDGWISVEPSISSQSKKKNSQTQKLKYQHNNQENKLINQRFQQFLVQSRRDKYNQFDPSDLFKGIQSAYQRFKSMAQQDAQELLRCLLDQLSTGEEKIIKATKQNLIHQTNGKAKISNIEKLFGFYLCNYLECLDCGNISRTFDFCLDISLQISKPKQFIDPRINQQQTIAIPKKIDDLQNNLTISDEKYSQNKQKINKNNDKKKKSNKGEGQVEADQKIIQYQIEEKKEMTDKQQDIFKYNQSYYREIDRNEIQQEKIPYFDVDLESLYQLTNINEDENQNQNIIQKQENLTLYDCLDAFTQYETLNLKNNYFKCEKCYKNNRKSSAALRKFFIYESPEIITLVLKRFSQKSNGRFEKIGEHVEFPETLDLGAYIIPKGSRYKQSEEILSEQLSSQVYKLFGVVVHSGTINGGHYVAYSKHKEQNEDHWFYYSDTQFKEVQIKNVLDSQAYILFYEKYKLNL